MSSVGSRKEAYEKRLALAMAVHSRLGQMSPLTHLEMEHLVKCAPEIPIFDPSVDPAKNDPDLKDGLLWDLNDHQLDVFRLGGTWADVFNAREWRF